MSDSSLQGIGHLPFVRDDYWRRCSRQLGYELATKQDFYSAGHYHPLPTAEAMHRSRATHRVVIGGQQGGKSEMAAWEAIPYLWLGNTRGWVVSASYSMAMVIEQKIETALAERYGMSRAPRVDMMESGQFSFSGHDMTLRMYNGSWLGVKSIENPDSLHAVGLDYIILDEANLCPAILYDTRLIPRLVVAGGWILSVGTLENEAVYSDFFRDYYEIGQVTNDFSIASWRHPTEDNFHLHTAVGGETLDELSWEYRANTTKIVKDNPDVSWPLRPGQQVYIYHFDKGWLEQEKKRMNPEIYSARYEAVPGGNLYQVFPTYRPEKYCDERKTKFDPELPVYISIDPGGTYAVSAIQMKRFPGLAGPKLTNGLHMCKIDEVYFQTTVTTDEVYQVCQSKPWWPNVARLDDSEEHVSGVIDVRAKEQRRAWEQLGRADPTLNGRFSLRARNVNINDGIKTLQYMLDEGAFWNNPENKYTNLEFKRYQYATPGYSKLDSDDPRKRTNPKDAWNHLLKADSYFLVNLFGVYRRAEAPVYSGGRYSSSN